MTSSEPGLRLVAAAVAPPAHPRGQHLRGRDPRRRHLLSRQLPQPADPGAGRPGAVGSGDDRAHARRRAGRAARSRSWSGSARIRGRGCASTRADGARVADSWRGAPPTYTLRDPATSPGIATSPRWLDNGFDAIVGAPPPARYSCRRRATCSPPGPRRGGAAQRRGRRPMLRRAPDGTPYIAAAQRIEGADRQVLLLTVNARDVRRVVRAERFSLVLILLGDPDRLDPAVALPRPDDRQAAAPARPCRAPGAARQRARGRRADACPRGATRSASSPARSHDMTQSLQAADRRHRRLRRRRHPRAQEPARLAALGGRHARAGRGSGAARADARCRAPGRRPARPAGRRHRRGLAARRRAVAGAVRAGRPRQD